MLTRRSSKLMLVSARGECSPQNLKGKDFFEVSSSGKHNISVSVFLLQSRGKKMGKKMPVSWGQWDMAQHTLFEYVSTSFLWFICFCLPPHLVVLKGKKGNRLKPMLSILLSVSFLSHCWDNCKRLYHWLAMGYHFVGELYTEVELQVELNNVFTFCSLSLEA